MYYQITFSDLPGTTSKLNCDTLTQAYAFLGGLSERLRTKGGPALLISEFTVEADWTDSTMVTLYAGTDELLSAVAVLRMVS